MCSQVSDLPCGVKGLLPTLAPTIFILHTAFQTLLLTMMATAKRQNGCLSRPYKQLRKEEKHKAKEKRKDTPIECRVPKNSER